MTWPMSRNHAAVWAVLLPHYNRLMSESLPHNTFVSSADWLGQLDQKERGQANGCRQHH